jgi:hypothetical protein
VRSEDNDVFGAINPPKLQLSPLSGANRDLGENEAPRGTFSPVPGGDGS